jgi:arylsulfatase A-like enzyme
MIRIVLMAACLAGLAAAGPAARPSDPLPSAPDILVITVDTLRYDHLSINGDPRPITPNLDRLLARGLRFTQARTVEPLTSPALCSLFTSRQPHRHGSTRNGLRMRSGLTSLPLALRSAGWETAAFVSNWTLRHKLSGLGEHFVVYE